MQPIEASKAMGLAASCRKKLQDSMEGFNKLMEQVSGENKETMDRRYYTVTREKPDDRIVDFQISTGESKTFLQKAIQQGRWQVMNTISKIQERHDTVKDMQSRLEELHQVFLDMAVLVEHQGEQLNVIESGSRSKFLCEGRNSAAAHGQEDAEEHQEMDLCCSCMFTA